MDERTIDEKADGLRAMATDALQRYSNEVFAGGEPVYPQWAADVRDVLDSQKATIEKQAKDYGLVVQAHEERAAKVVSLMERLQVLTKLQARLAGSLAVFISVPNPKPEDLRTANEALKDYRASVAK